jgi:phosphoglycolate phosphatase
MSQSLFNQQLPKAIFFDLDGTLVDSVPDLAHAIDAMLQEQGYTAAGEERVRLWVGNGARKLVLRALANARQCAEEAIDKLQWDAGHQQFLKYYAQCHSRHTRIYPHVKETLQYLQDNKVRMAVITNKPQQFTPDLLTSLGLAHFFECVVCGDTLPQQKPDPAPLFHALQQMQVDSNECIMVGDSRNDIEAANAAGMRSVCVSYGYNHGEDSRLLPATWHINSFEELLSA